MAKNKIVQRQTRRKRRLAAKAGPWLAGMEVCTNAVARSTDLFVVQALCLGFIVLSMGLIIEMEADEQNQDESDGEETNDEEEISDDEEYGDCEDEKFDDNYSDEIVSQLDTTNLGSAFTLEAVPRQISGQPGSAFCATSSRRKNASNSSAVRRTPTAAK
jgi:hypothetical protein